ncbi:hypothetical protein BDN70DRAFT_509561 [Pholiota conissans]|uniref:Uncharacterized protein n=1 Tax=Pholiota conissans TaxID=109636 RepID=A0A9P6CM92_9AGAR|nr:hypothetical protein BDN70DRAFT_509561 [Pholiota conissans]
MAPRPILKRPPSNAAPAHHHHQHQHHHHPFPFAAPAVHFPPNPALTRTFSAYSAQAYDRSPIQVSPNSCALPERGCPGRTYLLDESAAAAPAPRCITAARDYHPRALAFASANNAASSSSSSYGPVPPLIPDLSSESEESDGVAGQAPVSSYYTPAMSSKQAYPGFPSSPTKATLYEDEEDEDSPTRAYRLRGGAYPPPSSSPPALGHYASFAEDEARHAQHNPRRRRERRHESSRDPDRIPGGEALSLAGLSISASVSITTTHPASPTRPSTPSPQRKKGVRRQHAIVLPPSLGGGGFGADDGCLGGF